MKKNNKNRAEVYGIFYHQQNRHQWSGPYLGDLWSENDDLPLILNASRKLLKKKVKLMRLIWAEK